MFTKSFVSLGALALATVASAKPIPAFKDFLAKRGSSHSFNNYGGYSSMSNFDDFYGSSDYSGVSQTLVKTKEVVCHTEQVEIVQQHLAVIREWYKKIITEQICEVEVQTIVHEQFVSGCEGYSSDLRRKSSRDVSYDHNVASQITAIHDSSSNCATNNLGWKGYQVGSNAISYSGDNWNSQSSPSSVDTAYGDCQQSYGYSSPSYSSSWSSSYSAPSYGSSGYGSSGYGSSGYSGSYGSSGYSGSYGSSDSYGSSGYSGSSGSYEAPSYSYSAPSYDYNTYSAPSYDYNTYDSSYGSGYSYVAPPTYTSVSYGNGYSAPSSYGYGSSSGYAPPSSGSVSPDISSNLTGCASCGSGASIPTDSAAAVLPTDTSIAAATAVANSAPALASASPAAGSSAPAAASSAPAAASSAPAAASSAPAAVSSAPTAASSAPAASASATA